MSKLGVNDIFFSFHCKLYVLYFYCAQIKVIIITAVHIFKPDNLPLNRAVYKGHVLFHF